MILELVLWMLFGDPDGDAGPGWFQHLNRPPR